MSEAAEEVNVVPLRAPPFAPANDEVEEGPGTAPRPLAGLKVLEFSHTIMASWALAPGWCWPISVPRW